MKQNDTIVITVEATVIAIANGQAQVQIKDNPQYRTVNVADYPETAEGVEQQKRILGVHLSGNPLLEAVVTSGTGTNSTAVGAVGVDAGVELQPTIAPVPVTPLSTIPAVPTPVLVSATNEMSAFAPAPVAVVEETAAEVDPNAEPTAKSRRHRR